MTAEKLIKEIKSIIKPTHWLTPLNLENEQKKFLKIKNYNPQLIYPELPADELKNLLQSIEKAKVNSTDRITSHIIHNTLKELSLKIKLLLARGASAFSDISLTLYQCSYNQKLLNQAKQDILIKEKFGDQELLTAEQTVRALRNYLKNTYNITDWTIKVSQATDFYIRTKPIRKLILISRSINWDFCDLDNTFAHEIDGHIIRTVNASKQRNLRYQKTWPFYIKTEEGLASYLGDYFSTTGKLSLKHHALKYLGGHLAKKSSFSQVFDFFLNGGFTPPLAFRRTFRLKRGFEDTSMPGCYGRESMYYEGMLEVKRYIENGGDLKKIYAGKMGLQDIHLFPLPNNEIIPKRLKVING